MGKNQLKKLAMPPDADMFKNKSKNRNNTACICSFIHISQFIWSASRENGDTVGKMAVVRWINSFTRSFTATT